VWGVPGGYGGRAEFAAALHEVARPHHGERGTAAERRLRTP